MFKRSEEKLHRLQNNQNDWDGIADEDLNVFQRVAKKTKGIITVGNTITTVGAGLFTMAMIDIANGQKEKAAIGLIGSRVCDLGDGYGADITGTKGKIGRDYDPTVDAAELMIGAPILTAYGAMPLIPTIAMTVPKVIESAASINARKRGIEVNPTDEGKLGAGLMWFGIGSFIARFAFERHLPGYIDTGLEGIGWAGTIGGVVIKAPATMEYWEAGFGPMPQQIEESGGALPQTQHEQIVDEQA
jgi:phosphatidylglycerophosphate synthase